MQSPAGRVSSSSHSCMFMPETCAGGASSLFVPAGSGGSMGIGPEPLLTFPPPSSSLYWGVSFFGIDASEYGDVAAAWSLVFGAAADPSWTSSCSPEMARRSLFTPICRSCPGRIECSRVSRDGQSERRNNNNSSSRSKCGADALKFWMGFFFFFALLKQVWQLAIQTRLA